MNIGHLLEFVWGVAALLLGGFRLTLFVRQVRDGGFTGRLNEWLPVWITLFFLLDAPLSLTRAFDPPGHPSPRTQRIAPVCFGLLGVHAGAGMLLTALLSRQERRRKREQRQENGD